MLIGCRADLTTVALSPKQPVFTAVRANREYSGRVAVHAEIRQPGTTDVLDAIDTTMNFVTAGTSSGAEAVTRGSVGVQSFLLFAKENKTARTGTWREDMAGVKGRPPMRVRKVANEGAPPSLIEYTSGTHLVLRVETTWSRSGDGWLATESSFTTFHDGDVAVTITRRLLDVAATGNIISPKAQPAHAQAQAVCCTGEYGDFSDALFMYNVTYAGWVAACGITGIGGCAVGVIGLGGAAWFLDNKQEALQECWMENMANADCSLAGFLRAAPLHEAKKASPWHLGQRSDG